MSIGQTQLITEQEVKNWTDIPNSVQTKMFAMSIVYAQDQFIRSALGELLFSELLTQVENDTLTALNTTLLNGNDRLFRGLKPALAWWVAYQIYPHIHSYITPTGIQTKSTEDATSVSASQLEIRRNIAKSRAEYYLDQVICYLRENDTDYPLFRDSDDCCTDLRYSGYGNSGIVTDDDDDVQDWIDSKGLTREDLK